MEVEVNLFSVCCSRYPSAFGSLVFEEHKAEGMLIDFDRLLSTRTTGKIRGDHNRCGHGFIKVAVAAATIHLIMFK